MADRFRAQDLTGGQSRTVKTLILVLARPPPMTLVPGVNADKWDLKPVTGTQGSLWATGRRRRWLMMPSGGYCLRHNQASALSNQNCIIVQECYLCAIRLKCSGNHYTTLLKNILCRICSKYNGDDDTVYHYNELWIVFFIPYWLKKTNELISLPL